ncbi:hypothetical protein [Lacticaseibacillus hulanensis]|uniref:hypothetical protein n=1 Tax=Lacticaseibacillus hulanensis TaxID=2493111 RepID=UPI000FDC2B7A|nr:hypothetical protein [Lacticaseibacillus hulanensis]
MQKSKVAAYAITATAAVIAGACLTRAKLVHAANMRKALATAKAQTSHPVLGSFLDHTPVFGSDGIAHYNGGVIINRDGKRAILPFQYIEATNQIKRTISATNFD